MIKYIDEVEIKNKRVLVRVDYNVSFKKDGTINDDTRIKNSLPTLQMLLEENNMLILMSHLGKPKGRDMAFSMKPVAERMQSYLPDYKVVLINDFLTEPPLADASSAKAIYLLENTRFYEGEKKNDPEFSRQLAGLADIFVDDAFGSVHRAHASTVGVARLLPSFGGLLLKREVTVIKKVIEAPERPVVAIIAGAKISSKIGLIEKLLHSADAVLIGGAMTNNFLKAKGVEVGKGLVEPEYISEAKRIFELAEKTGKHLILPIDCRVGNREDSHLLPTVKNINQVLPEEEQLDIGPATEALFAGIISSAKTIIWNGPVGYFENPQYELGSISIYNSIISNSSAISVLGGGDTLSVIKKLPHKDKITHISTGGGAMLELIEKGTLPGLDALDKETNY